MKSLPEAGGFTLLELLTVIAIIIALAAMIIAGMGYANQKAHRSRAVAEIAAISTAMESYKADNGEYVKNGVTDALIPVILEPNDPNDPGWVNLNAKAKNKREDDVVSEATYKASSGYLAYHLCGQRAVGGNPEKKYLDLSSDRFSMDTVTIPIGETAVTVKYLIDPFGYSYGYSTAGVFNPTFDLWSYNGDPQPPYNEDKKLEEQPKRWINWSRNW